MTPTEQQNILTLARMMGWPEGGHYKFPCIFGDHVCLNALTPWNPYVDANHTELVKQWLRDEGWEILEVAYPDWRVTRDGLKKFGAIFMNAEKQAHFYANDDDPKPAFCEAALKVAAWLEGKK